MNFLRFYEKPSDVALPPFLLAERQQSTGETTSLLLQKIADFSEEFFALRWCRRGCLFLLAELIDGFDQAKNARADDHELDDDIDKVPVAENCRPTLLGISQRGIMFPVQGKIEILEIDSLQKETDWWHDDVIDQSGDNFPKGDPHNDADGEIHDIAPADEILEFRQDLGGVGYDGFRLRNHEERKS